jgi:radical SAM protein with 4Fe4S-binding SPASM domain
MFEAELNNPLDVEWEITNACNLRCRHCYVAAGEKLEKELDTNEALRLVAELDKIGVTDITISGGEPLLRSDLWQVIEEINSRKVPFMLYTNATLLDEEKIKKLAEYNVKGISLSLNGATAETHNFVQNADTFEKVLWAIKRLNDYGIAVQALFTLMKVNVNEFDALIDLAKKSNISSICIYPFYPQGRGKNNLDRLALDPKTTIEFISRAVQFKQHPPVVFVGGCLGRKFRQERKYSIVKGNPCGKVTAIISADGHLRPCNFLPFRTKYGVREKSISELWNEPVFENVRNWRKKIDEKVDCENCLYFPVCMGICLSMHSSLSVR